ncbi:hypothetical protein ACET3Z_002710 [Daucus carota]
MIWDFKSTNILLNDKYEAKISDFRLAKFMPDGHENCVTATVLGTFVYFDPEYKLREDLLFSIQVQRLELL